MEAIREGTYVNITEEDSPTNTPKLMKRHRPDIKFHSTLHRNSSRNHSLDDIMDNSEITDPKTLTNILETLKEKSRGSKTIPVPIVHHAHRNSTIAKGESPNIQISAPLNSSDSEEALWDILDKLKKLGDRGSTVLQKVKQRFNTKNSSHSNVLMDTKGRHYSKPAVTYEDDIDRARRRKREIILSTALGENMDDEENDKAIEEVRPLNDRIYLYQSVSVSSRNCN